MQYEEMITPIYDFGMKRDSCEIDGSTDDGVSSACVFMEKRNVISVILYTC